MATEKNKNSLNYMTDDLTNKIDSNKTISRLSMVIKELIENSIDSEADNISIFIKEGGLSLIEVKDNGKGIKHENFGKLCQRFNSSKIKEYDDINSITTFGFRGEALSILSYISKMTILSRTEDSQFGYEATFKNGKILSSELNDDKNSNSIKRVVIEVGTVIKVENIFYNNLIRKNYYDKKDETKHIYELVSKYAFHFHKFNFDLAVNNYSNRIISTNNVQDTNDILKAKRTLSTRLFYKEIKDNLYHFNNKIIDETTYINTTNINLKCEIHFECYFTKPSANLDKSICILFLNNRLISHKSIKKAIEQVYSKFLIKNGNYFVYLVIECNAAQVDVNVTSNKSKVLFQNEEKFILQLKFLLEENLNVEINSKNYYVGEYSNLKMRNEVIFSQSDSDGKYYAKDKIRVDTNTITLEKYLSNVSNMTIKDKIQASLETHSDVIFDNIFNQLYNIECVNAHATDIIKNNFYIGYESKNNLAYIQQKTSLYIVNIKCLMEEFMLYSLLKRERIITTKIKSEYKIDDIIKFVENEFPHTDKISNNLEIIKTLIQAKINILQEIFFIIDENFLIQNVPFFNLFNNEEIKCEFIYYIPMIYYSFIDLLIKENNNKTFLNNTHQMNSNLNFTLEILKILCFYTTQFYINILSNLPIDDANNFIKEVLFDAIKSSGFFIRKNIRQDHVLDKLIDTETLYTVFERC